MNPRHVKRMTCLSPAAGWRRSCGETDTILHPFPLSEPRERLYRSGSLYFHTTEGIDKLHTVREAGRPTRAMEWALCSSEGWGVQVSVKASSNEVERNPPFPHS